MTLRFGDEKSLDEPRDRRRSSPAQMLMRGTAKHTRQQIQDEFDRLKARVCVSGGPTAGAASHRDDAREPAGGAQLVAEVLREPAFPATEFEQLKQEQLAGIEQQRSEPTQMRLDRLPAAPQPLPEGRRALHADARRSRSTLLKAATLDDVKKFYADFYGASNGELAVVGDFDEKEMAKLASELFGTGRARARTRASSTSTATSSGVNQSFETPDKANAFFIAGINLKSVTRKGDLVEP